jgi:tRNA pseudouridine65 synthase
MEVTILYCDDTLAAVDKPSGMLVHRGWDNDDLVLTDIVRQRFRGKSIHPLHRLDRQTSGVVLFALDPQTARILSTAFEHGKIDKTYLTLVRGIAPEAGVIDHPIPRTEDGPRVEAVTEFRRLAALSTFPRETSWVEARPRTGRLHQIRRHLKHISHPVIGDAVYGKGDINRAFRDRYGLHRTALHAASITFEHPFEKTPVTIGAPLPSDLADPLRLMGLELP